MRNRIDPVVFTLRRIPVDRMANGNNSMLQPDLASLNDLAQLGFRCCNLIIVSFDHV